MNVPDLSTNEYLLCWPSDLLIDEIQATLVLNRSIDQFRGVLGEAFVGRGMDDLLKLTEAGFGAGFGFDAPPAFTKEELATAIIGAAEAGTLRHKAQRPRRYSERNAASRSTPVLTAGTLRRRFKEVVSELDSAGYFDREGAEPCVDDSYWESTMPDLVQQELGLALNFEFSHRRSRSSVGDRLVEDLGDGEFYDLVEHLHDLASRPRSSWWHDFNGCGYHYSDFSIDPGQRLYRWRINQLFDASSINLRLAEDGDLTGRLIETTDEGRTELVDRVLHGSPSDRDKLAHALDLFRQRGTTDHTKRSAIIVLAGLLEENRLLLKTELFSKDEGALFHIANQFAIRHNTASQQSDYDPVFLDWVFWSYLATVELTQRLLDRQNDGSTLAGVDPASKNS